MRAAERTALVTGSSGHIGGAIVRALLERGFRVRGLDLTLPPDGFLPYSERFEPRIGDVRDQQVVSEAALGVDAVFHLAMKHLQHLSGAEAERELTAIAVEGLASVVEAARQTGARLVYTSTAGAVGETRDPDVPRTEDDWNDDPVTPYTKAKIAAERWLWENAKDVHAVALLPGMTIGPHDPHQSASNGRIEQMYRRSRVPFWFSGGLNIVDVRDLAEAHMVAVERGQSGRRYLVGGHNLTFRELATELRRMRGQSGSPRLRVPDRALISMVGMYERAAKAGGQKPFVTARQVEKRLGNYAYIDNSRARAELGFQPRPLEQSLRDLLLWSARVGHIPSGIAPAS
jgi:dihydroflavonol-4-reductase